MNKTGDIPPIGAGNAMVQINQRNSKHPRQKPKDGQKHEQTQNPPDIPNQDESHDSPSDENHLGVDRYV
jgi:hypothetical protein